MADKIAEALQARMVVLAKQIGWWTSNRRGLLPIVNKLEELGFDVSTSGTGLEVTGSGDKAKLLALFKTMRGCGYAPRTRPTAGETYWSTYWYEGESVENPIWISFCSTVCKRVQVGTEMKEVPVYEVRCGEDATVTDEEINNG